MTSKPFTTDCRECARLATFLDETRLTYPTYFCKPVPPFGVAKPLLLIVGLAPGIHGANRTGRPFTGDYAGELLYSTLHKFGFANQPNTVVRNADDTDFRLQSGETLPAMDTTLKLIDCRITNAVKCLPPQNKPVPEEIRTCNQHLKAEIAVLPSSTVVLALGGIAHESVLMAVGMKKSAAKFGHEAMHALPDGRILFNSYHCSRYNTNTRRLTEEKFHDVFRAIRAKLT